jgi:hypothetical protein
LQRTLAPLAEAKEKKCSTTNRELDLYQEPLDRDNFKLLKKLEIKLRRAS